MVCRVFDKCFHNIRTVQSKVTAKASASSMGKYIAKIRRCPLSQEAPFKHSDTQRLLIAQALSVHAINGWSSNWYADSARRLRGGPIVH